MVTAEEIATVSIFADLGPVERERLSRVAADIRVVPGEFAIHPGDERALYAVLEGHLDTVTVVDGVERVVGGRRVGELIGEVPIALGTRFPFGFRAAEPSRLMRVEAQDYYAIAGSAPEVAVKLGELARSRIEGLQNITSDAATATCNGGRSSLGRGVRGAPALSRSQSGHVHLDRAR